MKGGRYRLGSLHYQWANDATMVVILSDFVIVCAILFCAERNTITLLFFSGFSGFLGGLTFFHPASIYRFIKVPSCVVLLMLDKCGKVVFFIYCGLPFTYAYAIY